MAEAFTRSRSGQPGPGVQRPGLLGVVDMAPCSASLSLGGRVGREEEPTVTREVPRELSPDGRTHSSARARPRV